MKIPLSRFLFFAVGFAAVRPAASLESTGQLTVSDTRRTKLQHNTICAWHFTVINSTSGADTTDIFSCNFNVKVVEGTDCGVASFETSCSANSSYTVNGGHSDQGFVVVVLVNNAENSLAYFAFSDDDLDAASHISNQTMPTYPQATAQRRDLIVGRQDNGNSTPSSTAWKVEDMFRGIAPKPSLDEIS
ncbi:uncharacterized protein GGS22DRAFT_22307 [Annulohypoxylon maeteangense]|uniref:uncharacterized protein n=1 Tax=Annulohypoxylon maeteangense TaxID=1927788 RepID=UPI0020089286|nr:uncharacterized protein GGS22DRAFT_22307 [Annulohypoxylon maeteangense]KAI0884343.1 hypothetical protein GGS22DRAFT_22307 [Annulohypoxylon maeteangense]